jgi:hypothetical protein
LKGINEIMENMKKEYKLVFNSGVARRLLRMGINIADIKADRANPDKTVFVFKRTPEFEAAFEQMNKEIAEAKAQEAQG